MTGSSKRGFVRLLVILAGLAALAGSAHSQPAPTAPSGEELGHVRYEQARERNEPWRARDGSDDTTRAILFQKDLATPNSTEQVDIVATVTIDYRLSSTDRGNIRFGFFRVGGGGGGAFDPGSFPVRGTSNDLQTGTFVWSERGVPANGQEYTFQLEAGVRDGHDRGNNARGSGSRISVVIEMWPAE